MRPRTYAITAITAVALVVMAGCSAAGREVTGSHASDGLALRSPSGSLDDTVRDWLNGIG